MATIIKRKRSDGTIAYLAQLRMKRDGKIVHHESRTFDKRKAAVEWSRSREVELNDPHKLQLCVTSRCNQLKTLLQRYIDEVNPVKPLGKTKRHTLERMQRYEIASKDILDITTSDIINYCRCRNVEEKAGPHTISADLSYLRTVIAMCRPAWNIPASTSCIDEAKPVLKSLNLIGSSNKRKRRLETNEYDCLLASLERHDQSARSFIPMATIFKFSIHSMMRVSEVCRITWADVDRKAKTVIVRERKDPHNKINNDQEVALLGPAWEIIQEMPAIDERIFPYNSRSISQIFNNHRSKLHINDLRYHDLRREGISRLIEMGYSVEEVATVSGHKNLRTIWEVYTQIKSEKLHDKWERLSGSLATAH
ncbi:MAG: tyrosine-type recombinase/integrase [Endozoicomonas sp.]